MPETVDVFGQKIPTTYVWIGGAVVVGIVGYAWWTQGRSREDFLTEEDITSGALDVAGDERFPMDASTPEGPFGKPPATNAEWTQTALERMHALGIGGGDLSAASSAIGKVLQRQPLSKVEADLVRQAIAHAGFPPQNGPWVIIEATKPPPSGGGNGNGNGNGGTPSPKPTTIPGISGLRQRKQYRGGFQMDWQDVPNGFHYEIYVAEGRKGSSFAGYPDVRRVQSRLASNSRIDIRGLQRGRPYRIFVRAAHRDKKGAFTNVVAWTR